ncbi:MAG: glycine--tRNA ligase subunit beta [Gammaproteobacteria bacterium RIFCSPHIGHO2_12_FULL_41_20]|nr:MAG: glycine--tRNA ligase subunit beta [Gammaproteobacteria bacterium RIFCSPHIGHO2_12_FULL_41_20]
MIARHDFLVEILSEELPPKALSRLGESFLTEVTKRLREMALAFDAATVYMTPRRLAVLVHNLASEQPSQALERKGPALAAAYDKQGNPTSACLGFARSCGVSPEALITIKNKQGEWVGYRQTMAGKSVAILLPVLIQQALTALPIPKRMRWGQGEVEFVRPVHSVIMLYGHEVIETTIIGCRAGRVTYGHRVHASQPLEIPCPQDYSLLLKQQGYVIADFVERKEIIREQATALLLQSDFKQRKPRVLLEESLLNEVTGLVEWPVAICGQFDPLFLLLPPEVLISSMQDHQRYFPIVSEEGKLLPGFVTISNLASQDTAVVIQGNERVLRARLKDAVFFFDVDKKERLEQRLERLKGMVFQAKLGTLYDKSQRLSRLAMVIAKEIGESELQAARIGLLAKTDLTTDMVGEFPELQGVMGYYYALHDGEPREIAEALKEHYLPRFAKDYLPASMLGCVLALADRLDTLVGVFGLNQAPTGDKDPFGLRRAAMGVLRILVEKELNLDLAVLLEHAQAGYQCALENVQVVPQIFDFMQDRLKSWYQEQGITADVFAAVAALNLTKPFDFYRRIQAVRVFKDLNEAEALSLANKRVSNILQQHGKSIKTEIINPQLFEFDAERTLAEQLEVLQKVITPLYQSAHYVDVLTQLARLRKPIDDFFDHVMVMVDNPALRENRLALLSKLRALFLLVADIALLQE